MDTREKYQEFVNTAFVAAVDPLVIEKAEGATYYGEDGGSYIDCWAGIAVVNSGHCNEAVLAAAQTQMEKLVHCCSYVFHVKPVADLAEKLAQISPGNLQKSFFGNSGAEAIEGAARLAKRYTCKNEAVALTHSFHGRTYGTLSLTGNSARKKGGGPYMPGVAFAPAPYCYRCPLKLFNPETCGMACAETLADVIQFETSDNVAFFVAEPVMGEGGIIMTTLKEISPKQVAIGDIRGKGLMIGIEIVKNIDSKEPATAEAAKIRKAVRDKGVLLGLGGAYGNVLRVQPPLTISDDELDKALAAIKEVMES
jgi:4-aminobutyrate aminotransferase/(S)-3-amino-2-methylpropionate transaminase